MAKKCTRANIQKCTEKSTQACRILQCNIFLQTKQNHALQYVCVFLSSSFLFAALVANKGVIIASQCQHLF